MIKFFDTVPNKKLKNKIIKNLNKMMSKGSYIMGPNIKLLENKLAKYVKSKYCVSVSSGTDALLVSLMALNLKRGDEVITTAFSYISTAEIILNIGCKPVFVDIDLETSLIDLSKIEKKITNKTKAIIVVSLFGIAQDLKDISKIAKKKKIKIIEDAAQSFGTKIGKEYSCNLTDIGCTSFFPTKALGGYGDSGAIFTNDKKIYQNCLLIRQHGQNKKYNSIRLGLAARMDEVQSIVLLEKLKLFNNELILRRKIANRYNNFFKKLKKKNNFIKVLDSTNNKLIRSYSYYSILVKNRKKIINFLKSKKIPVNIYYPITLNQQKTFKKYSRNLIPNAEYMSKHIISLPLHPYMKTKDQTYIIKNLKKII